MRDLLRIMPAGLLDDGSRPKAALRFRQVCPRNVVLVLLRGDFDRLNCVPERFTLLSRRLPVNVSVTIRPQHREARILAQMQEGDAPRIKSGAGCGTRR